MFHFDVRPGIGNRVGFKTAEMMPIAPDTWRGFSRSRRIREAVAFWGENGGGIPTIVLLMYVVKMVLFAGVGLVVIGLITPAAGGLGSFDEWWSSPIFFQKAIVWALLFEILGLGCSAGPMTQRTDPLIGGVLYFLRPGMVRLPPWPRIPGTKGATRTPLDVGLYALVLACGVFALVMQGHVDHGERALQWWVLLPLVVSLAVLGFRDEISFLAARSEHYWVMLIVLMFPFPESIAGAQVMTCIVWWGASLSKMNLHFPYVVSVMMSNSPIHPWKPFRRRLFRDYPNDMRPSKLAAAFAHGGTVIEAGVPFVLLFSHGWVTYAAVAVIVLFHFHIIGMFPMGIPGEWNLMMIVSAIVVFGGNADLGPGDIQSPWLIAVLCISGALVLFGNLFPKYVSFLVSMRYYAGNWAAGMWCFRGDSEAKLGAIKKLSATAHEQLVARYPGVDLTVIEGKQVAFRSMHPQGRALHGLIGRAVDDPSRYTCVDGEVTAGPILGWNFGDGHLHDEQLIEYVQSCCHYEPGELRIILLESQPLHTWTQRYRIIDAATGLVETGYVKDRELADAQPWLNEEMTIPVYDVVRHDSAS
jgi:hypothetical protein